MRSDLTIFVPWLDLWVKVDVLGERGRLGWPLAGDLLNAWGAADWLADRDLRAAGA